MIDLTQYTDDELSLEVFNTEHLYIDRHKPSFLPRIAQDYIYTTEQLGILLIDLEQERAS